MKMTRTISFRPACRRKAGFTLVEAMILVVLLGITAAVVGQSLTTMSSSATTNNLILQVNDQLLSQMETLRSSYTVPPTSTPVVSNSTVSINGKSYTVQTEVAWADPTAGASPDGGNVNTFLLLQVQIGNQIMSTYVDQK